MNRSTRHFSRARQALLGALAAPLLLVGCDTFDDEVLGDSPGGGGGGDGGADVGGLGPGMGSAGEELERATDGTSVFVDANAQGLASEVRLLEVFWGRKADVYDQAEDGTRTLRHPSFVIGQDIVSDGEDYELVTDPITEVTRLTILHPKGSTAYQMAFQRLGESLVTVNPQAPDGLGPFTQVARNATLVLRFSDILDPSSISADTIRLLTGIPSVAPFQPLVAPDPNFGQLYRDNDGDGEFDFRPTRVQVDVTISEVEASMTFPPPPVNNVGLPQSSNPLKANVLLRIPTAVNFSSGLFVVLQNLRGNKLGTGGANLPVDSDSPTVDLVRAFRSGASDDPFNGFLRDETPPRIVGQQDIVVSNIRCATDAGDCAVDSNGLYLLDIAFDQSLCEQTPELGDILELTEGNFAEVLGNAGAPDVNGVVRDVPVRDLTVDNPATNLRDAEGQGGLFLHCYDPLVDNPQCFVSFSPDPGTFPVEDVLPGSLVQVRFSEAMDPASLSALEDFLITRADTTDPGPEQIVVGAAAPTPDLKQFNFDSTLPFSHEQGMVESYFLQLGVREEGLTDLAGNRVLDELETVEFKLDPDAVTNVNGGFVLRFNEEDLSEGPQVNACDGREISGQFLHDPDRGVIKPRPVLRFSMILDRDHPTESLMGATPVDPSMGQVFLGPTVYDQGTNEPMVGTFGCRMMTVWRYCDMGLSINKQIPEGTIWDVEDTSYYNVDVEGLNWAPAGGSVVADFFDEFEIALGHASRFPDEGIDVANVPATPPWAPNSGLRTTTFADNALPDGTNQPLKVVHSRERGYNIDPVETFFTPTDKQMMPFPLNQSADPSTHRFYTWRDTAIQSLGGSAPIGVDIVRVLEAANSGSYGMGIPPQVLVNQLGLFNPAPANFGVCEECSNPPVGCPPCQRPLVPASPYAATFAWQGAIPSIAMPLLMDFRCFPDTGGGFNNLDVGVAGSPLAGVPFIGVNQPADFRVTSTGGVDTTGIQTKINPDLALVPTGGFNTNPATAPATPLGAPTPAGDSLFYMGQLDLVYRVSRLFTRWIDTGSVNVTFLDPVLSPANGAQPNGTSVRLAFRGASLVGGNATPPQCNLGTTPPGPLQSTARLDSYGDERQEDFFIPYGLPENRNPDIVFFEGDSGWKSDIAEIDGAIFFQARISMINNVTSGTSPELTAIGFVYDLPD